MNAKIITVWGANGSGKTTVAVNLAAALADRDFMVGIISSKLSYGEIQSMFGKRIEPDKGIYKAISNGCNTKNMFEATNNPNLFILSPPNVFDGLLLTAISEETIKDLIADSTIRFDYIIIDGSEELNNPVSSIGLTMSNKIVRVYKVSAKDCIWHKAMENMTNLLHLREKTITVINGYDKTCDKLAFFSSLDVKYDFELPYVSNCAVYANSGKLIYNSKLSNGQYKKTIQKLAGQLMLGG